MWPGVGHLQQGLDSTVRAGDRRVAVGLSAGQRCSIGYTTPGGIVHGRQTGGDGELTRGLRASRAIAHLDRGVGGWRAHRRLGRYLRMVVLLSLIHISE